MGPSRPRSCPAKLPRVGQRRPAGRPSLLVVVHWHHSCKVPVAKCETTQLATFETPGRAAGMGLKLWGLAASLAGYRDLPAAWYSQLEVTARWLPVGAAVGCPGRPVARAPAGAPGAPTTNYFHRALYVYLDRNLF